MAAKERTSEHIDVLGWLVKFFLLHIIIIVYCIYLYRNILTL